MARSPLTVRSADVKRAIRIAESMGFNVSGYEVDFTTGKVRVLTTRRKAAEESQDEFERWVAEHAG